MNINYVRGFNSRARVCGLIGVAAVKNHGEMGQNDSHARKKGAVTTELCPKDVYH